MSLGIIAKGLANLGETVLIHVHRRKNDTVLFPYNKKSKLCHTVSCQFFLLESIEPIIVEEGDGRPLQWDGKHWK